MAAFTIYPAIDIRGGKCVRLVQGDYGQETVYDEQPVEVAKRWEANGASWIHVVDLDGAKEGRPMNAQLVGEIARTVSVPIQVGGGLRTLEDIELLLDAGVPRVILGTAAIEDRDFVETALGKYGERIAIGIDARNGFVATRGWLETSEVKADILAAELAAVGAKTFIFTDISRDGMMKGPNVEAIVQMAKASGQQVIASGGVSSMDDIRALSAYAADGVAGAIIGKALYTGGIDLTEAVRLGAAERS
ncbi:1-(5-phosphoribosyl)-5-[(5-phosphoribosylamino)methylideneamino]imidazole-4-carboxamide isomerase [Paenibacillus alvei]|uniref:1-(5-phosphoribosyl)-5-[(5- phosphoribosylamino)methylideneamino]imidazole-4- carboxamide isomerase n=1 Tax=Paenibacillus alvei TaxID=44250 RepID=UPI0018CC83F9|nr:1-(5-phosphoribosyl)-5-[(5-phosphoribosylamino)methylideneamino]imidazole-4-carboxamide isomerase [Paenibacillus alvei]MBG9733577.1 1-(5-phosphoribosyl)-5-[(5-phosphoribosylamino)methylideneamino] imidazole-4-carboxamide isomerase [Paenibacillus alvei]MBG9745058.1 1-(5-phosphoribosyl)-5-[(5-phosphoribosylamino)methylideneamino] imidazole-4-carboxamide isomerase [Paenibacillus alvei]MCY9582808.1 1-(5-phosphoribosyl)-5-[(5-phosphoribosylamino)methylideneamino]imidazole-4-carboxamide isomerase [